MCLVKSRTMPFPATPPMLDKSLSPLDFTRPGKEIHHQICGLADWPCATAKLEGSTLKILRSEWVEQVPGQPGEITVQGKKLLVACGDGSGGASEFGAAPRQKAYDRCRFPQRAPPSLPAPNWSNLVRCNFRCPGMKWITGLFSVNGFFATQTQKECYHGLF